MNKWMAWTARGDGTLQVMVQVDRQLAEHMAAKYDNSKILFKI